MTQNKDGWREDFDDVSNDGRNSSLQRFIQQWAIIVTECKIRDESAPPLITPDKSDLIMYWHDFIEKEIQNAKRGGAIEVLEEVYVRDWRSKTHINVIEKLKELKNQI